MISRPLSLYSLCHSRKWGKVATHGPHQTAQKSSKTTLPLRSDSLVGFPFKENSPLKSGARLPMSALYGSSFPAHASARTTNHAGEKYGYRTIGTSSERRRQGETRLLHIFDMAREVAKLCQAASRQNDAACHFPVSAAKVRRALSANSSEK